MVSWILSPLVIYMVVVSVVLMLRRVFNLVCYRCCLLSVLDLSFPELSQA